MGKFEHDKKYIVGALSDPVLVKVYFPKVNRLRQMLLFFRLEITARTSILHEYANSLINNYARWMGDKSAILRHVALAAETA